MTSLVHIRYRSLGAYIWLRATEKLQERSLAARLSYQVRYGFAPILDRYRKSKQNQGWHLLMVGLCVLWQGSRARSAEKSSDPGRSSSVCRITGIMLNPMSTIFLRSRGVRPPETTRPLCVYNIPVQECL